MPTTRQVNSDPLADKVAAWWLDVLAGQGGRDHPVYGSNIRASFKEDTLRVEGVLESRRSCVQLQREIRALRGTGIATIDFNVHVDGPPGERGVLKQLILAFFVNDDQADLAKRYLDSHPDVRPIRTYLVHEDGAAGLIEALPDDWRPEVERGFKGAGTVLVVEVDEVEAFRANELLADNKIGKKFVLPPQAY